MKRNTDRESHTSMRVSRYTRWFPIVLILFPIVLFSILEGSLRFWEYGLDTRQWIPATAGKILLNPEIGKRYFRTIRNIPVSNQDIFDEVKKDGAFRVFVLGESSGAGYPYTPVGSFSRWLRTRLSILYPNCTIEIVNVSMTAINSYTLLDLFPGILEQRPDLVLIYAGHNEYYGALGVGSSETAGAWRVLVRLSLALSRLKTYELLQNGVRAVSRLFSDDRDARQDGTLMSRMAQDQYIELDSDKYLRGLDQFEDNLRSILDLAQGQRVPVILSTLASNIKDQRPFVSLREGAHLPADIVFARAESKLASGDSALADSLFRYAKDLDALRFRAPEEMNRRIQQLAGEYHAPLVDIDSMFRAHSPQNVVGDNLMTDHLHPTLEGYALMAKAYYAAMKANGTLPPCPPTDISESALDVLSRTQFKISRLDSILATYRIAILKNDWPYIDKTSKRRESDFIRPKDTVEQAAYDVVADKANWESAHRKVALWYLANKDFALFQREMDVLISQYPVIVEYYDLVANELMKLEKYDEAYSYLTRRYSISPNAYSAKWIGIICLSRKNTDDAIRYLEESVRFDGTDAQAHYNLAGAYVYKRSYTQAMAAIRKCLLMNQNFPKARELERQLIPLVP